MRERSLLVTTIKDEGPNILEWVAHHRLCGFDTIMVFQNNSSDFTVQTLKVLDRLGAIRYLPNGGRNPQIAAYRQASADAAFKEHDWCMTLDGDEFLNIHVGSHQLPDLLAVAGEAEQIHLNWRLFGSSGHTRLSDALVVERFQRSERVADTPLRMRGFKTLFRTRRFDRIGIHRPRFPIGTPGPAINGSGLSEGEFACGKWRANDPGGQRLAQINHYAVRDAESYLLKVARGRAHQEGRRGSELYWRIHDLNGAEDTRLATRAPLIRAEMERLDAQSGGRLMHLRRRALKHWQSRVDELHRDDGYSALFAYLTASDAKEKSPA